MLSDVRQEYEDAEWEEVYSENGLSTVIVKRPCVSEILLPRRFNLIDNVFVEELPFEN